MQRITTELLFAFLIPATYVVLFVRILYLKSSLTKEKKGCPTAELTHTPSDFYSAKSSCLSRNEALMFHYLNTALTRLVPNPVDRKNYHVFPQVPLSSMIRTRRELCTRTHSWEAAGNSYISGSIDFVICYCYAVGNIYQYKPLLLIELDGLSNALYEAEPQKKQMENDAFDDTLFSDLNLPFCRFTLNESSSHSDLPKVCEMLRKQLPANVH